MSHPTATYNDTESIPDGYEFATEIAYQEAVELATAIAGMTPGDVVDFQSGIDTRTVKDVIFVKQGCDGTTIGEEDGVTEVLVLLEPLEPGEVGDEVDVPTGGPDELELAVSCASGDGMHNTARLNRSNYHNFHSFTYGDILDVESAEDGDGVDFVVEWRLIPECMNPNYAHHEERDDLTHGEATQNEADNDFFNRWADAVDKKTIIDSEWWVEKELDTMSTDCPIMLVPVLYSDGIIKLQDMATDRAFGFMDVSQTVDKLHEAASKELDQELRREFLSDIRYPFGITLKNDQHFE